MPVHTISKHLHENLEKEEIRLFHIVGLFDSRVAKTMIEISLSK